MIISMALKRITYVSHQSKPMSSEQINALGELAAAQNARQDITGILIYSAGLFYQVIEGPEEKIDSLFEQIKEDKRHTNIFVLEIKGDYEEKRYSNWSINTINLEEESALLVQPLKDVLNTLARSHTVLERYTQPSVVKLLEQGINPLTKKAAKVKKVVLFSDIMGFNLITSSLNPQDTLDLVNAFFKTASEIVDNHSGVVSKLIGDCIMAVFDEDQAMNAVLSGIEILKEVEALRNTAPCNNPLKALHCGVGIDCGEVIEGNVGSHIKTDFTVIGEAANHAAWLESLTRKTARRLLFSPSVAERLPSSMDTVNVGSFSMKHKADKIPVYSVHVPTKEATISPEQRNESITKALGLLKSTS
jgi:class 3 adenylate cyclase